MAPVLHLTRFTTALGVVANTWFVILWTHAYSEHEPGMADAAHLLTSRDVERVPVVADGILKGFLTRADLVRRLLGSR